MVFTMICKGGKNVLRYINHSGENAWRDVITKKSSIDDIQKLNKDYTGNHRNKQAQPYLVFY